MAAVATVKPSSLTVVFINLSPLFIEECNGSVPGGCLINKVLTAAISALTANNRCVPMFRSSLSSYTNLDGGLVRVCSVVRSFFSCELGHIDAQRPILYHVGMTNPLSGRIDAAFHPVSKP
jgi:hypothetical protein